MFDSNAGEAAHSINGVPGRMFWGRKPGAVLWTTAKWISEARDCKDYDPGALLRAQIRFDDYCGNGRQSFSVTGEIYRIRPSKMAGFNLKEEIGGGCAHDEIAAVFPELAGLIRWHLCDTAGPMHYLANTVYLAGDRDCHDLHKGERRQIMNGKTGEPAWHLAWIDGDKERPLHEMPKRMDGEKPSSNPVVEWRPWCQEGEGKNRELDAARNVAVWPDATDADLMQEPEVLRAKLAERLPGLLAAMRADVVSAGFDWKEPAQ